MEETRDIYRLNDILALATVHSCAKTPIIKTSTHKGFTAPRALVDGIYQQEQLRALRLYRISDIETVITFRVGMISHQDSVTRVAIIVSIRV